MRQKPHQVCPLMKPCDRSNQVASIWPMPSEHWRHCMQATELHLDRNTEVATQRPAAIANAASLPWCFLGLCLYLISQAYLIPLWPQGPSWAVWPRVADFAGGLMAAACLWHWQSVQRLPAPLAKIMVPQPKSRVCQESVDWSWLEIRCVGELKSDNR